MKPDILLADKLRTCRYFRSPISDPMEPETSDDDRSRETTLFLLSQPTPYHLQGVALKAFQLEVILLGSMRFLDRARRARPSELKLHDDETKAKNRKNQYHTASLIVPEKVCIQVSRWLNFLYANRQMLKSKWTVHF